MPAPPVDRRTAEDLAAQVRTLLATYVPEWKETDPVRGESDALTGALIEIFAHFGDIIIQRLNQAPEKNFLAFLDLLGASLMPPQPARVPLTFSLAPGVTTDTVVRAGTQAAAPPAEGEANPVIFETERELVVTAAALACLYAIDPDQDRYEDLSSLVSSPSLNGIPVFHANQRVEHTLYLGHSVLLASRATFLRLSFQVASTATDPRQLVWEFWDGANWTSRSPVSDGTKGLANGGDVEFDSVAAIPLAPVNGQQDRWIRCRLATPITPSADRVFGMVRQSQLPFVSSVSMAVTLSGRDLAPEMLASNGSAIEPGTGLHPFGEKPKLNDVFYIAQAEAFSKDKAGGLAEAGGQIRLDITVDNSQLVDVPACVRPSPELQLSWECWNGRSWRSVGTSGAPEWARLLELDPTPESTAASSLLVQGITQPGASLVTASAAIPVGDDGRFAQQFGLKSGWNVLPLMASYKDAARSAWVVVFQGQSAPAARIKVEAPKRPVGKSPVKIGARLAAPDEASAKQLRVTNGLTGKVDSFDYKTGGMVLPLVVEPGRNDILIEALGDGTIAATTFMIGMEGEQPASDVKGFFDGTYAFTQNGSVALQLPDSVAPAVAAGQEKYWIRVRLARGDYGHDAFYKPKDPAAPAQGFTLVQANYRPPALSQVSINYDQTLSASPDACFTYNAFAFEPCSPTAFAPFRSAQDATPTLYLGLSVPPGRSAPANRTLSIYTGLAESKFGAKTVPIAPERSKAAAAAGAKAAHEFTVTSAAGYALSVFGTRWPTELQLSGATPVVQVTVPGEAASGASDRGFLLCTTADAVPREYTAEFSTWSGEEQEEKEAQAKLAWDYWAGGGWAPLNVRDDTKGFTRPGLLQFLFPADLATSNRFGSAAFWVRVRRVSGRHQVEPRLRSVLLNTTMAAQAVSVCNEVLGASGGRASQEFRTSRSPVLQEQQLQVREPEMPPAAERETIEKEEGGGAISVSPGASGRPSEIWVRWHEVPDFYGSKPRDRHYVLDHITGSVRFGDGLNGMIPPRGAAGIRMARYRTGGGASGDRAAGTIVQLKTTTPYIDKVTNPEAAAAGADAETLDSLRERAPRMVRHRGRAVSRDDFEDLARLATPEVARALCVPVHDLAVDLDAAVTQPGWVSVIIVPRSSEPKPLPSLELIGRVKDYLEAHVIPTAGLSVVGPEYVRVDVAVRIALRSLEGAADVQAAVLDVLARFLHPLTGGIEGKGWDFGREPHKSDLYAIVEQTAGVDHVVSLEVTRTPDRPEIQTTGRFLVYSGRHTATLEFIED